MPTPKLTGLLYNCALNSALPSLLKGISHLAQNPEESYPEDDPILENYRLLKNCFATYYWINPASLRWSDFNGFLESHSFYAKEMILAPVFRNFIAKKGPDHGYQHDDLWLLKDVQDHGRYNPLETQEAANLFHSYFGISLQSYSFEIDHKKDGPYGSYQKSFESVSDLSSEFFGGVGPVILYLKGQGYDTVGHFELQPHELMESATIEFTEEVNTLPPDLLSIHQSLSSSQSAHETNQALGHLVVYVTKTLKEQIQVAQYENYMLTAAEYAELGRVNHNDTISGNHTFAVILLTILVEFCDTRAQTCLDQLRGLYRIKAISPDVILNNLSKAIIDEKGNLEAPTVVTTLKQAEALLLINQELETATEELKDEIRVLPFLPILEEAAFETNEIRKRGITEESSRRYRQLVDRVRHEPGWGHRIAGLMLAVLGIALIMASALTLSGSLGLAAAPALPAMGIGIASLAAGGGSLYAGIHFFRSGIGKEPEPAASTSVPITAV